MPTTLAQWNSECELEARKKVRFQGLAMPPGCCPPSGRSFNPSEPVAHLQNEDNTIYSTGLLDIRYGQVLYKWKSIVL